MRIRFPSVHLKFTMFYSTRTLTVIYHSCGHESLAEGIVTVLPLPHGRIIFYS